MSLIEGTCFIVNVMDHDVWGSEDELTGALSGEVEIWGWLYL